MQPNSNKNQTVTVRDPVGGGQWQNSTAVARFFRTRLRLTQLRMLVAVSDHGQLKKVAAALNITPPAVSKQIAEIEDALQNAVTTRVGNHIEFTVLGELLAKRSREILAQIEQLRVEVADLCAGGAASLGLGISPTVGTLFSACLVKAAKDEIPSVAIKIYSQRFELLAPMLKSGAVDLVIAREIAHQLSNNFSHLKLMDDPIVVVCAAKFELERSRTEWSDIKGLSWIVPSAEAKTLLIHLTSLLQKHGVEVPKDSIESSSITTTIDLLQAHPFVTVLPLSCAEPYIRTKVLAVLPVSTEGMLETIYAVWRNGCSDHVVQMLTRAALRSAQEKLADRQLNSVEPTPEG